MEKSTKALIWMTAALLFFTILIFFQGVITMNDIKIFYDNPNLHYYVSGCFFIAFIIGFISIIKRYVKSLKIISELSKSKEDFIKFKEDFFKEQEKRDGEFRKNILETVHIISNNVSEFKELAKQIIKLS